MDDERQQAVEELLDETSHIGAGELTRQMHKSEDAEVVGHERPLEHTNKRDMQDVVKRGDLSFESWHRLDDKKALLHRERKGQAAVDNKNPVFTHKGWEFYRAMVPNEGSGGLTPALAVRHSKSAKQGERPFITVTDLLMIGEASPKLERKMEDFIKFCLHFNGFDWRTPGNERMRLYNALQFVAGEFFKLIRQQAHGQINNTRFVASNSALESMRLTDTD